MLSLYVEITQLTFFLPSLIVLQHVLLISQHDYQQHHVQGPQSVKRASHKFSPYPPYSGSKSHHQGSAGKKYAGKYPSSLEGASSSGSYPGMFKSSKPSKPVNIANRMLCHVPLGTQSSPTFSVRPRSSAGRVTVDLKDFFLCLVWFPNHLY